MAGKIKIITPNDRKYRIDIMKDYDYEDQFYSSRRKKLVLLVKIFAFFMIIMIIFFCGTLFEKWGGTNRLMPVMINFLRNNFFGDDFVLKAEKSAFSINDFLKQKYRSGPKDATVDRVEGPLKKSIVEVGQEYLTDHHKFHNRDFEQLSLLANNIEKNLNPYYQTPIRNEGVWEKFFISPVTYKSLYEKTFLRTDLKRNFVKVYIYKFDLDRLKLDFIPGKDDSDHELCTGRMSPDQRKHVLWAFSGGFQYRHGRYGMKYQNEIILPPKKGAATLLFYKDGSLEITEWKDEFDEDENIYAYRQNELLLVIDNKITSNIDRLWGLTPNNVDPIYTVRSGVGLTDNNELVFVFGEHLSARTLALGMIRAGVVNGMHLDMNYYNVHFVNYERGKNGKLYTYNENEVLSYYKNIYSVLSPRDYFIILDKTED